MCYQLLSYELNSLLRVQAQYPGPSKLKGDQISRITKLISKKIIITPWRNFHYQNIARLWPVEVCPSINRLILQTESKFVSTLGKPTALCVNSVIYLPWRRLQAQLLSHSTYSIISVGFHEFNLASCQRAGSWQNVGVVEGFRVQTRMTANVSIANRSKLCQSGNLNIFLFVLKPTKLLFYLKVRNPLEIKEIFSFRDADLYLSIWIKLVHACWIVELPQVNFNIDGYRNRRAYSNKSVPVEIYGRETLDAFTGSERAWIVFPSSLY